MEQNYRLTIAYDGSRFFGWERQPDKDTIQGKLEAVLGTLQGYPVNVIGAGRTDAGVHARAMTANVVLDVTETPDAIRDYLNRYLPDAIAVREVKEAAPRFHARYNALGKTYRYTCHTGPVKPVFDRKYVTLLDYDPDVEKMRQAAAHEEVYRPPGGPHRYRAPEGPGGIHLPRYRLFAEHGPHHGGNPVGGGPRLLDAGAGA